jgi:NAD(P)-dependent dehydrogenase (short-subunit alcohol dehydrogenase family)
MSASEFASKRVFITGGSKGVGEAIVRRFASGGASVGTTARSPLPEGNAATFFVQADLSTRTGVDKII